MSAAIIAERYARALSETISDDAALEPILRDIQGFSELLESHGDLYTTLNNPAIPPHGREGIFVTVLDKAGLEPAAGSLLTTLFDRRRIGLVGEVATAFSRIVDERLNRVTAEITTAKALNGEQAELIRKGLSSYSGKTVNLNIQEDPEILGGIIARMDGKVIDGSLRARLDQMKQALLAEES